MGDSWLPNRGDPPFVLGETYTQTVTVGAVDTKIIRKAEYSGNTLRFIYRSSHPKKQGVDPENKGKTKTYPAFEQYEEEEYVLNGNDTLTRTYRQYTIGWFGRKTLLNTRIEQLQRQQ